jgi:transcription initiation factor IIF auxiliary subunit
MKKLSFTNWSMGRMASTQDGWYDWCVFADAGPAELEDIAAVEYTLHPTFPDPIRKSRDRADRFALYSNGWGEFAVKIEVQPKTGKPYSLTYNLRLDDDNWPRPEESAAVDAGDKALMDIFLGSEFRWRRLSTLARKLSEDQQTTEVALTRLSESGLVRKSSLSSVDGDELWGATAKVGLSPSQRFKS